MVKKLIVLILIFYSSFTFAETIKTDVLVIGNGASAVTAALQCAHSKVKTVLVVKGGWLENMQSQTMTFIDAGCSMQSGLWGQFRKNIREFYKQTAGYDTTYNAPLAFQPFTGAAILKRTADTTQGLTIKLNTACTTIEKNGTGWEVTITTNGQTDYIKARVLVDATENGDVITKAGATLPMVFTVANSLVGNLYRTSISVGDCSEVLRDGKETNSRYTIPMKTFVVGGADNLFVTDKAMGFVAGLQDMPVQMNIGQGVGTMAAFCAFFRTTDKNLAVRKVQNELLDFKGYLLPFDDIKPTEPYFRALQQIAATGLLKGKYSKTGDKIQFLFLPDSVVTTAEIKPVLTEIYSRAFIWFGNAKPQANFTVGNLLSFICEITLSDPDSFKIKMQKDWKSRYKFTSPFDANSTITRRQFAILANQYLNPFARTIDMNGRMVN